MDDECGVRTVPPPKPMLVWVECVMSVPRAEYFAVVYPHPYFPKNLEQHEGAESVKGDTVVRVLGFGIEPSPSEPCGGATAES